MRKIGVDHNISCHLMSSTNGFVISFLTFLYCCIDYSYPNTPIFGTTQSSGLLLFFNDSFNTSMGQPDDVLATLQLDDNVRRAHAVASELAISDHVIAPKLPKPNATTLSNLRQLFAFPMHISSSSPRSSCFPHLLVDLAEPEEVQVPERQFPQWQMGYFNLHPEC